MASKSVILFDNRVAAEEITLTDEQLRAFEELNKAVGDKVLIPEQVVLKKAWRLRAGPYVGTLRVRDLTIQILPKIHRSEVKGLEAQSNSATKNLLYMLKYAENLKIHEHNLAHLLQRKRDWFEVLTFLFASRLHAEIQRGFVKDYTPFEDDIPFLKGKWLIHKQLHFAARNHILSVAFDEFTEDNNLNRVFRYVAERLWRLTADSSNKCLLGDLCQIMSGVTLLPAMTSQDVNKTLVSRLHLQYEPILNLARLFLDDGTLQVSAGKLNTFAFVFDMNKLFEDFIVGFIQHHRQEILPEKFQNCILQPQSKGTTYFLARRDKSPVFKIEPDLVFRDKSGKFPLLLDTKYKLLNTEKRNLGVEQGDFYQMFAYVHRYPRCEKAILVYPWSDEMGDRPSIVHFDLEDIKKTIGVTTIDLHLDLFDPKDIAKLKMEIKNILGG